MQKITIITAVSFNCNSGDGAFGIMIMEDENKKFLSKKYKKTTYNKIALQAMIYGIERISNPSEILIYTTSKYFMKAFNKNRIRKHKKERGTSQLWERFYQLSYGHTVNIIRIKKGTNPYFIICKRIARICLQKGISIHEYNRKQNTNKLNNNKPSIKYVGTYRKHLEYFHSDAIIDD